MITSRPEEATFFGTSSPNGMLLRGRSITEDGMTVFERLNEAAVYIPEFSVLNNSDILQLNKVGLTCYESSLG